MTDDYKLHGDDMLVDDSRFVSPHPGPMIRDQLEHLGVSDLDAARAMDAPVEQLRAMLAGKAPVGPQMILGLSTLVSPGFASLVQRWEDGRAG